MNHYAVKVHVRPELRYGSLLGGASLPQVLARGIEDVAVSQWQSAPTGGEHLLLEFSRPADNELLADIQAAAGQVGYALVEAEVEEFVDKAVSGAIVGFCGSGGGMATATRDPLLSLIAAAIGGYVGAWAGASVRTLVASYRYQVHRSGRWIVTELPVSEQDQMLQPDPSAAFLPA